MSWLSWRKRYKCENVKRNVSIIFNNLNLIIRKEFPRGFQKYGLQGEDLIGVEIGTFEGYNALNFLKGSSIKKLYLIDPYEGYESHNQATMNKCEKRARKRLRRFKNKIIWVKKLSSEAVKDIAENNLDFVYIDGNHAYEYVKEDIKNYYKKLKIGGILAGHDFVTSQPEGKEGEYGIIKAVLEFVNKNKLKLNVFNWDWWIVKCEEEKCIKN